MIVTDVEAAIISDQQVIAILWIDPDRVMIAVRDSRLQRGKLLAAVCRFTKVQATDENIFRITRIDTNLAVIHRTIVFGAASRVEAGTHHTPGFAFVV